MDTSDLGLVTEWGIRALSARTSSPSGSARNVVIGPVHLGTVVWTGCTGVLIIVAAVPDGQHRIIVCPLRAAFPTL